MACGGVGSYDQQRLAKKKYKLKKANQFKTNFIALWEKYGEFQDVNGVLCFGGYRIDRDGEGQRKMSRRLQQPNLWQETDDSHFDWVKIFFNLGKLLTPTPADVDAFFVYYKNTSHNIGADKLHYQLEKVATPNDYGYYTTEYVVTEHWFERAITEIDADGIEQIIGYEQIVGDDFLDELSWELADLALDSAVWFDPDTLQPIEQIVIDEIIDEVALDLKIDGLRATEFGLDQIVYKVVTMSDKIREYTIGQSVGENILDDLTYTNYFGDDGQYYLSVDAARKMNGLVFVELVIETLDFNSKLKSKYKWRKRLLGLLVVVGIAVALFFGRVDIAEAILLNYLASKSNNKTLKILAFLSSYNAGGGFAGGLGAISSNEAVYLIFSVSALYFSMQDVDVPIEYTEDADKDQQLFYKMPYDIYDEIYCFDNLIEVSVSE